MYRSMNNLLTDYFSKMFSQNSSFHAHNTDNIIMYILSGIGLM